MIPAEVADLADVLKAMAEPPITLEEAREIATEIVHQMQAMGWQFVLEPKS